MGFLHKLWDETLAGPTPDSGLGKLRKYDSFSLSSSSGSPRPFPVSTSITILQTNNPTSLLGDFSGPDSPLECCVSPTTPLTPLGMHAAGREASTRREASANALEQGGERRSPSVYDWIVISALDR